MPRTRSHTGKIWRRPYSRKTRSGKIVRVKGNYIRAVSQSGQKRSTRDSRYLASRAAIQKKARQMFRGQTPKHCPVGRVLREGFSRHSTHRRSFKRASGSVVRATNVKSSWTGPTCVPSINRVKKKRLFVLEKGDLKKYGYHDIGKLSSRQRKTILKRALADIKPLSLYRKLNALYVLQKRTNPSLAKDFKDDAEWIKTTSEYNARPTARSQSKSRSRKKSSRRRSRSSRK